MLLIDGDILVYQAISAAEQVVETEPDLFVMFTQLSDAKDNFVSALTSILIRSEQDEFHICLSDRKSNWRKNVYPEYKSNRKKTRLPMGFLEFRKWVEESYPCISKPTLEADDVLGILATKPANKGKALIWTIDKDLKTVPGWHLLKEGKTLITEHEADYYHMMQTLTGDVTDGYPGCKGIGPKKAETILHGSYTKYGTPWAAVLDTYKKAGFDEEFALTQARVARICRWQDWDEQKQEVRLWSPSA